jgi:hypothetical protein
VATIVTVDPHEAAPLGAGEDTANSASPTLLARVCVTTLPERGLDRMTPLRIESQLCTTALTAHI